jgi:hypothetical protein
MLKIFKWITKLIPKNLLPDSTNTTASPNTISIGMVRYEKRSGGSAELNTSNVYESTSEDDAAKDLRDLSTDFGDNAVTSGFSGGGSSQAAMLATPYGLSEFWAWKYNSCLLVGTKVLMFDGTEKNIEDLELEDELYSPIFPGLTESYHDYKLDSLENLQFDKGKVKRVVFDFVTEYYSINKKYNATPTHAIFAWKDKYKRFEWWQMKDLELGDKLVNPKLELEEITTIEKIEKELEVVSIGLKKYNVFFADGYMNHD